MSFVLSLAGKFLGLFGVNSTFWAGIAVAGTLAVGFAGYSYYVFDVGYDYAQGKCQAAALLLKNKQLAAALAEKERQLAAITAMQQQDAQRAADAESKLKQNQESINATPANPGTCLDRAATGRVRDVR